MPRPLMPVGDRRVTVTLTVDPDTLDYLDTLVAQSKMSRGRVIDLILRVARSKGATVISIEKSKWIAE